MSAARQTDPEKPLLLVGDSYRHAEIYHLTGFLAPDAFVTLEHGKDLLILASSLEFGRAQKESRATAVRNLDELGLRELAAAGHKGDELMAEMIVRLLKERGLGEVDVPRGFPVGLADPLRAKGITLGIRRNLAERRRTKRPDEVAAIEAAQRATEEAWALGVDAIRRSTVNASRELVLDGAVFTAERLRALIEAALLERGCGSPEGTICAPGPQAADPHQEGTGPLHAGESIVMDIYPQSNKTRYYADMTRTVSKGEPHLEIVRMYEVVKRAQDACIAALKPGVTGRFLHELAEDIIFEAGYDTLRPGQQHGASKAPQGFIHGLGHGVGLEIHEEPSVGRSGTKPLLPGDVVTIEPGVYDPAIGGVRLEDMLLVTADGARNLTRAPRQLIV